MVKILVNDNLINKKTKLAITKNEQALGLMWNINPPIMIFPYKVAKCRKFWMKNTPSPLELIFCNAGYVVDIKEGKPFDENLIGPDKKSDIIIEAPIGFCKENSIDIGTNVNVKYSKIELLKLILVGANS